MSVVGTLAGTCWAVWLLLELMKQLVVEQCLLVQIPADSTVVSAGMIGLRWERLLLLTLLQHRAACTAFAVAAAALFVGLCQGAPRCCLVYLTLLCWAHALACVCAAIVCLCLRATERHNRDKA